MLYFGIAGETSATTVRGMVGGLNEIKHEGMRLPLWRLNGQMAGTQAQGDGRKEGKIGVKARQRPQLTSPGAPCPQPTPPPPGMAAWDSGEASP